MSLALSDREGKRARGEMDACVNKEGKGGESWNMDERWVKGGRRGGGKNTGGKLVEPKSKVHIKPSNV